MSMNWNKLLVLPLLCGAVLVPTTLFSPLTPAAHACEEPHELDNQESTESVQAADQETKDASRLLAMKDVKLGDEESAETLLQTVVA